jgi:iron complex outermembrane recepter protein
MQSLAPSVCSQLMSGSIVLICMGCTGAFAQQGDESDNSAARDGSSLEEVIVTARKREEPVQDIPAAISVLSEATLERIGADDFQGFARTVPGLNLNQVNAIQNNVNIRGVSTTSVETSAQSTVAFYIDDLPTVDAFLSRAQPDLRLFDVNRVEVLRGPQGTLFGSGALSGAIRILTNKPDLTKNELDFEAGLSQVEDGNMGYAVNAMANVPVVADRFALRAVGYVRRDPGYIDNVITGKTDQNDVDAWGGRLMGRFKASDAFTLTGTILHQDTQTDDGPFSFHRESSFGCNPGICPPQYGPYSGGSNEWANYSPENGSVKFTIYNLVADIDLGPATLTSSSSYAQTKADIASDSASRLLSDAFGLPEVVPLPFVNFSDSDALAEELRLVSNGDRRIDYVVGGFYMKRTFDGGQVFSTPIPGLEIFRADVTHEVKEKALFGELIFGLTDKLDLTVGGRVFWNDYDITTISTGLLSGLPLGTVVTSKLAADDNGFNPKAVLGYQYSSDILLYATAARGYRTGFVNPAFGDLPASSYQPDTLWNYELGLKSYILNHKVLFNIAAYYIDWQDVQVEAVRVVNGLNFIGIANAGAAFTRGAEVEVAWQPNRQWQLSTAFSLNDSRLTQINPEFVVDAAEGSELPAAPNFTISSSLQYAYGWQEWENYLRLEHAYVGESMNNFPLVPASNRGPPVSLGDYHTLDLRAGFVKGNLELVLYGANLNNSDGVVEAEGAAIFTGGPSVHIRPRTFGVTARIRF